MFTLKLSDDARTAIQSAADRAGKTVSQWARDVLLEATQNGSDKPDLGR
ncbi:MAG: hypothetical protein ABSE49_30130 [Polyangiaceae bacterium]